MSYPHEPQNTNEWGHTTKNHKTTCYHHMCRESTESNTAGYRAETKQTQNSQQVFTGNQIENSRELGEECSF